MKKLGFTYLLLISIAGFSQADSVTVNHINPLSLSMPKGYSHSVEIDLGSCKMVIISGEVPLDNKGNLIGKDDLAKQTEQVFINIKNVVSESGGSMNNIVKLGVYMVDVSKVQTFRDVRNKFINQQSPPASTLIQVCKLFRDDVLLEVEATAIIPKKGQSPANRINN